MSGIGKPCERQLWYEINTPNNSEELRPESYFKFLYGDILEEILLFLAQAAGHDVQGRQDELVINGIKGHRDAIIDGMVVDCKSASTYSFKKFSEGLTPEGDAFGYLGQLGSYVYASKDDPRVLYKNKGAFLVCDKTLGHITLDIHEFPEKNWEEYYDRKKNIVSETNPPPRGFEAEPEGKSGNLKLGVNCSYCPFNKGCWPEQRTFLYAHKPVTLVKVVREPNVTEIIHHKKDS